jgi:hypothetical protein
VALGSADVTATVGAFHGSSHVLVRSLVSKEVTPADPTIANGSTQAFQLRVGWSDGSVEPHPAVWISEDEAVATIDANGVATGRGPGTATITALFFPFGGVAYDTAGTTLTVVQPAAVLVVSTPGLGPDRAVYDRLVGLGYSVTWMPETALDVPAAGRADLVVLSSSVHIDKIGNRLRSLPTALLTFEGWVHDDNRLSTTAKGEATPGDDQITIVSPASPLAAGRTGDVTVSTEVRPLSIGTPTADADVIATVPGHPDQAVIFAYGAGDHLSDGSIAPAPRLAFFFSYETPAKATPAGWALFDAAVRWLAA